MLVIVIKFILLYQTVMYWSHLICYCLNESSLTIILFYLIPKSFKVYIREAQSVLKGTQIKYYISI